MLARALCASARPVSVSRTFVTNSALNSAAPKRYSDLLGYENYGGESTRATTIVCVRKGGKVVMIGDGQVSRGATVVKGNAIKVRRLREGPAKDGGVPPTILVGMAGAVGDCLTLIERLEQALDQTAGNLTRACVALAKAWRTEKYLRHLDAVILTADATTSLMVSGNGDVIAPEDGVMAVGSGGIYALSAARALIDLEGIDAEAIARKSMKIASDICVYTNGNFVVEKLDAVEPSAAKTEENKADGV